MKSILDRLETADRVIVNKPEIRLGIVKDENPLSLSFYPYWPLFERFARNNNIHYTFINIHCSDWIDQCSGLDLIAWRPLSDPASLYEQRTKTEYIEKFLNIRCHPSFRELWTYEDKLRLYYHLGRYNLPIIPTFISFDEAESNASLVKMDFPLVSKSYVGSSSMAVKLLKSRHEARRFIRSVFSVGLDTSFPYFRQKGYVYFQKFIPDASFDLRIIMVGKKIFGYYRFTPKNDFRASGAGLVEKTGFPVEAVLLALKVKEVLPSTIIAVDLLKSESENKYYVIEASINIDIETPMQLTVDGIPGYYEMHEGSLVFYPGKYWLQELTLEEMIVNNEHK